MGCKIMRKVAIIGAGSIVFCKTLMQDIMATKALEDTQFILMAPSTGRTSQVEAFAKRVIRDNRLKSEVYVTTDRREALTGADYVITAFQIGGVPAFEMDYKIPLKHGVDQCIGDSMGPGGVFRALRSIPVILAIAKDVEELCPNATLLNYVNPMAMICWALGETNVKTGKTFKFNGNIRNDGMISNLPADCCAEGPIFADRTGLNHTIVGNLPPQCAALNLTNINVQGLAILAAKTGNPEAIVHACAMDPLTGAVLTLKEARDMAIEMLEAEKQWLPQFEGKTLRKTPVISIPKDVKRAQAPIDPALAIFARFGELAK